MRAGRLPEDHPLEIQARKRLRERALQEVAERIGQATPPQPAGPVHQIIPPEKPRRWN